MEERQFSMKEFIDFLKSKPKGFYLDNLPKISTELASSGKTKIGDVIVKCDTNGIMIHKSHLLPKDLLKRDNILEED